MRNAFAGGHEQATINVTRFQEPTEKIDKSPVLHPSPHTFEKQPVMDRIKVACQITFDNPAAPGRIGSILKLYLHGADGMMHAPFRPEAIGKPMEIASQIGSMAISMARWTMRPSGSKYPVVVACHWILGYGYASLDGAIAPLQQLYSQVIQMLIQSDLKSLLIHSVDAWCSCAT